MFFVYEDGTGVLPGLGYVRFTHTAVEDECEDLALWVGLFEMAVFDSVGAG